MHTPFGESLEILFRSCLQKNSYVFYPDFHFIVGFIMENTSKTNGIFPLTGSFVWICMDTHTTTYIQAKIYMHIYLEQKYTYISMCLDII